MLNVFFTVDVEVWGKGWHDLDAQFTQAFQSYIYGTTAKGQFGLPFQMNLLSEYGLRGVFFIEPLFSLRFGQAALDEIVGLVRDKGHEAQLHLHTEWADESRVPLWQGNPKKRQHLRYFSQEDQVMLIGKGMELMRLAGATDINAFRAGNFGFNRDTLLALAQLGIKFDSSYNASMFGLDSEVMPGTPLLEPVTTDGVHEYPMTVYNDGTSRLRHTQLTACTFAELEGLLWQALEQGRQSFVILSHGAELLNREKTRPDPVVVDRLRKLCEFLGRNRDSFNVCSFQGLVPTPVAKQPAPLTSPRYKTALRLMSQAYRRRFD